MTARTLKIVAISDTHGFRIENIPLGDVLIHAGDIARNGSRLEWESEIIWLSRQPHCWKIYVPGNHCRYPAREKYTAELFCAKHGIEMLVDRHFTIEGVRFFGAPWTPEFNNWSHMHTAEQAKDYWSKFTDFYHVLVTHGPPAGILDRCPLPVGCPNLLEAVQRTKPLLNLFGHIHEEHGGVREIGPTKFVNLSRLDGAYRPVDDPIFTCTIEADPVDVTSRVTL